MPEPSRREPIAVVGGGWAGCAAAVTLARAGFPVTLFEQAKTLGGRARRVVLDGAVADNGQHLLVGCYHRTLALVELVHGRDRAAGLFHRLPLTLQPFGAARRGDVSIAAWRGVPAPIHLGGALLTARGLAWRDRRALLAAFSHLARSDFACPPGQTVAELFSRAPRPVVTALWEPLCLAALNTPVERASAQAFARVLREAFTGPAGNCDFLIPATDLSICFPDAAARYVTERGGRVRVGAVVRDVNGHASGVTLREDETTEDYAAAIIAVGPHQLRTVLGSAATTRDEWRIPFAQVAALRYEPITTVYLRLAAPLPMRAPLLRLDDRPGQWIFCRSATARTAGRDAVEELYAVVISAGPNDVVAHSALAAAVEGQLRRLRPDLPAVLWSRVISERRATYACTPDLARPVAGRVMPRLYLAGDYTDPDLPATLEAATRSGLAAANALINDIKGDVVATSRWPPI